MKKLLFFLGMVLCICSGKAVTEGGAIEKLGLVRNHKSKHTMLHSRVIETRRDDFSGLVLFIEIKDENEEISAININTKIIPAKEISIMLFFRRFTTNPTNPSFVYLMNKDVEQELCYFEDPYKMRTRISGVFYYDSRKGDQEQFMSGALQDERTINLLRNFIYGESPKIKFVGKGKDTVIVPITEDEIRGMKEVLAGYDELRQKGKGLILQLEECEEATTIIACAEEKDSDEIAILFEFSRYTKNPTQASSVYLINKDFELLLCSFIDQNNLPLRKSDYFLYDSRKENHERLFSLGVDDRTINFLRLFVNGESPQIKLVGKTTAIIPVTAVEIEVMKEQLAEYDKLIKKRQQRKMW